MRFAAAILLSTTCFFAGIDCYAQDPCSTHFAQKPGERPLTSSELVHRVLLLTPPEDRPHLALADVEFILRCGTQQDAAEFFVAIRNTSVQIANATVVEADQDVVRASCDDGFKFNLEAFSFKFDSPLNAIPHSGDKILIGGTYSSYSREPFQINMTNSSFVLSASQPMSAQSQIRRCGLVVPPKSHSAFIPSPSPFLF
jgi:hypothetical protein